MARHDVDRSRVLRGSGIQPADSLRIRREKLTRAVNEGRPSYAGVLDPDGNVMVLDTTALDAAGLKRSDVEGQPFWEVFWAPEAADDRATVKAAVTTAGSGEPAQCVVPIAERSPETSVDLTWSLSPVFDEEGRVLCVAVDAQSAARDASADVVPSRVRDLLRARETQTDLEWQCRRLQLLFTQAPMLIGALRGPTHIIELANPPLCARWGREASDLLNRPILEALPELHGQVFPGLLDEVYRTGQPYIAHEMPVRIDGRGPVRTLYYNFVYSPYCDAEGKVEGVFIIASDVTADVRAREELERMRASAESANRAKDEFLAMLGHELRNPLSPILTALQLMKLRGESGSEHERRVIERQVNHLTRLVDDLLDVSRIARGHIELKIEAIEIWDVISKAIETVSPLLEQRTHTLSVEVPRQGLLVDGDPVRLSQVVSNLLTNAAKYTPQSGDITVRAERQGGEVVVSISDTGVGITAEALPHVFDLFVQERQSLDRSQGGLGLGLTIVRNLVERHGGTVSAHSDGPGEGTEVVVRLPASGTADDSEPGPSVAAGQRVAGPKAGHALRILVVDDNEDGAEMLAAVLGGKGYDTRVALDAPTALQVAIEFMPHIAFLDLGLPVMDGFELAVLLRGIHGLEHLHLVAVTGYGQESDRRRTREAGFRHHLVKPVNLDALDATLVLDPGDTPV